VQKKSEKWLLVHFSSLGSPPRKYRSRSTTAILSFFCTWHIIYYKYVYAPTPLLPTGCIFSIYPPTNFNIFRRINVVDSKFSIRMSDGDLLYYEFLAPLNWLDMKVCNVFLKQNLDLQSKICF